MSRRLGSRAKSTDYATRGRETAQTAASLMLAALTQQRGKKDTQSTCSRCSRAAPQVIAPTRAAHGARIAFMLRRRLEENSSPTTLSQFLIYLCMRVSGGAATLPSTRKKARLLVPGTTRDRKKSRIDSSLESSHLLGMTKIISV